MMKFLLGVIVVAWNAGDIERQGCIRKSSIEESIVKTLFIQGVDNDSEIVLVKTLPG
jgi:hypothetical protein